MYTLRTLTADTTTARTTTKDPRHRLSLTGHFVSNFVANETRVSWV